MATSRDDFGIAIRSALLQRGAKQKFSLFVLILASILIFTLDNLELRSVKVLRGVINDGYIVYLPYPLHLYHLHLPQKVFYQHI